MRRRSGAAGYLYSFQLRHACRNWTWKEVTPNSTSVHYRDTSLRNASWVTGTASLASVVGVGLGAADVADFNPFLYAVFAVVFGLVSFFYRSAVPVEVVVGPGGITKKQGLGLGWHTEWSSVRSLQVLPLTPRRLVVVADHLPPRRGLNEWPLRRQGLPRGARSVLATPEILDEVRSLSGHAV